MRILISGGAGYIGSVLVSELLRENHAVRVLDNLMRCPNSLKGIQQNIHFGFIRGDVSNRDDLRAALTGTDAVVHLAALRRKECDEDSERAWTVNYYSTLNLANLCSENGIRLVFASSCSIYGISNKLATEETVPLPISTYARTKICAEKPVLEAGGVVLRFATAYGGSPCMRKDLIVHQFLADAMKGKMVIYDPGACRAIVHVKDIAKSILLSVQTDLRGQIFNIGGGNYTKWEMARIICKHLPKATVEEVLRGDVRDYQVSFEKARDVLGFVPKCDLDKWVEWTCGFSK